MYIKMKLNFFNILVIVLFVLIITFTTVASCSNYKPYRADTIFEKHGKFEGFANNDQMLHYSDTKTNAVADTNTQFAIDGQGECKKIFGFDGLFCGPKEGPHSVDTIGSAKGSLECVGKSSGLSNSMGGLCLDENQKNLLATRGGNMTSGSAEIGKK
jgi:hypothetical protein